MDKYPRLFIQTSLIYLAIGVIIGFIKGLYIINGIDSFIPSFFHSHFNLLGFMTMIVAGIGYFIIPRFNSTNIYFPGWIAPHYWLTNVGVVLMAGGHYSKMTYQFGGEIFILGAFTSSVAVLMFCINMFLTITLRKSDKEDSTIKSSKPVSDVKPIDEGIISPNTKVIDIIEKHPTTIDILINYGGLRALASTEHVKLVKERGIDLKSAVTNHGGDIDLVISKLEEHINSLDHDIKSSKTVDSKQEIIKSNIIGDVLDKYPNTKPVFMKYYGMGCFTCPGQSTETIDQSARIHNVDINELLKELNENR